MRVEVNDKEYLIGWKHIRLKDERGVLPRGGATECYVKLSSIKDCGGVKFKKDDLLSTGTAICSDEDNYSSSEGRERSMGRAINGLFQKENRRQIWKLYFLETNDREKARKIRRYQRQLELAAAEK